MIALIAMSALWGLTIAAWMLLTLEGQTWLTASLFSSVAVLGTYLMIVTYPTMMELIRK